MQIISSFILLSNPLLSNLTPRTPEFGIRPVGLARGPPQACTKAVQQRKDGQADADGDEGVAGHGPGEAGGLDPRHDEEGIHKGRHVEHDGVKGHDGHALQRVGVDGVGADCGVAHLDPGSDCVGVGKVSVSMWDGRTPGRFYSFQKEGSVKGIHTQCKRHLSHHPVVLLVDAGSPHHQADGGEDHGGVDEPEAHLGRLDCAALGEVDDQSIAKPA